MAAFKILASSADFDPLRIQKITYDSGLKFVLEINRYNV